MKIKKIILSALFLCLGYGIGFTQNNKLPENITTFFEEHFLTETILTTDVRQNEYKVNLSNGSELRFDRQGNLLQMKNPNGVPLTPMHDNIAKYIRNNYKVYHVVEFEKEPNGYKLKLSNDVVLHFNSSGNMLKRDNK